MHSFTVFFIMTLLLYPILLKLGFKEVLMWSEKKVRTGPILFSYSTFLFLVIAAVYGILILQVGFSSTHQESKAYLFIEVFKYSCWVSILYSLWITDYIVKLLPYSLTFLLGLIGFFDSFSMSSNYFHSAVLFIVISTVFILNLLGKKTNSIFGIGDLCFLLALSFWFSPSQLLFVLTMSCFSVVILFITLNNKLGWTMGSPVSFGPFLAVSSLFTMVGICFFYKM